ncbi:MFS transporter [Nocardioides sp. GCM10027113]|uniref:MFS transporter n=1 Tax=unclassified Nocardioides TaxID=2615069 RepID=UPI0036112CCC
MPRSLPSRRTVVLLVGLLLLSLNLRPAAVSVGPVLAEVRAGLDMGAVEAGLLTSLPVLAFAVFGAMAPALASRAGVHRVTLAALLALVAGLAGRAAAPDAVVFLVLSLLALAGMAMANVLLPSLVKLHFPDRVGRVTALYTGALSVGLTASLMATVPVSEAAGSWRWGLGGWAALALLAALPWLHLAGHDRTLERAPRAVRLGDVARTPLGLGMGLAFGLQSMQAYMIFGWFAQLWRDAGFSPTQAGLLVGLLAGTSIPLSLWLPAVLARSHRPGLLLATVVSGYPVAYVGLMVAPQSLAVLWAVLTGAATTTFPLVLTLIGLRARTPDGTAALSGFTQSAGYLMAAVGPFTIGVLHDATGGWTAPLALMTALVAPLLAICLYVARPVYVEDQLRYPATVRPR